MKQHDDSARKKINRWLKKIHDHTSRLLPKPSIEMTIDNSSFSNNAACIYKKSDHKRLAVKQDKSKSENP